VLLETAKALSCKKYQLEFIIGSSKTESDLWCLGRAEGSYLWWLKTYCLQYSSYAWDWTLLPKNITLLDKRIIEVNVNFALYYENAENPVKPPEVYKICPIEALFIKTGFFLKKILMHIFNKYNLCTEIFLTDKKTWKYALLLNILIKNSALTTIIVKKKVIYTSNPTNVKNLNLKLPLAGGWYLLYLTTHTKTPGGITKTVSFSQEIIAYTGDFSVESVLSNKNFSKNIWIENDAYDISHADNLFLKNKVIRLKLVIDTLNYLNNTVYSLLQPLYLKIKELYTNTRIKKIFDKNKETSLLNATTLAEIERLQNTYFFLTHRLDQRTRVYVTNIPINYQLNHLVRGLIYSDNFHLDSTCKKLATQIDINAFVKTLTYKTHETFLGVARAWFKEIGKDFFLPEDTSLKNMILLESALDLFKRLGKSEKSEILQLNQGLKQLKEIYYTDLETFLNKGLNSRAQDFILLVCSIKIWFTSNDQWPKIWWHNDASANVIQLLCLKFFVQNTFTLQVANIRTNTTEFPDIYTYILKQLQNKCRAEHKQLLSRELIKSRVMPGTYGQAFLTFYNIANEIFLDTEDSKYWDSCSKEEQLEFLRWIDTSIWNSLAELDLDILNFLKLCRYVGGYLWNKCVWFNYAGLPIIIYKKKIFDRGAARRRIKRAFAINLKIERNYQFLEQQLQNNPAFERCSTRELVEKLSALRCSKPTEQILEKNNLKLNQALAFNKKLILLEKKNLQMDEKNYSRKNIKYKLLAYLDEKPVELAGYIKIRFQHKLGDLDRLNLKNNIAASSTHADDASIIIRVSSTLGYLGIPHGVIHDAIGSPIEFSSIIKFIFKNECAEYLEYLINNRTFPFNLLDCEFPDAEMELLRKKFMSTYENNREATLKNLQEIKQEILASKNLFN